MTSHANDLKRSSFQCSDWAAGWTTGV